MSLNNTMKNIKNGRIINLNDINNDINNIIGLARENQIPEKNQSRTLLGISSQTNLLSTLFFSTDNIKNIQDQIRHKVFLISNNKYIIDEQNYNEINIIMRSIYLQFSPNIDTNHTEQISYLNKLVIDWCVPKIITEIEQYNGYIHDVETLPTPIPRPINMSNTGMKNTRSVTSTF
jgi:hypothetical protein